jgi:hypothetical protein
MLKYFALLLLILSFLVALPAKATSICRKYDDREICILSIKRSAKNYWEYRASVSIDKVKTPIEVYNCRDRIKVQADGKILPFERKDPGKLICSFFKQS